MLTFECRQCKKTLLKSKFIPDKRRSDGIDRLCKECFNQNRTLVRGRVHNPPTESGSKRCSKCGETKSVLGFYKNPQQKDGRNNWCGKCLQENARRRKKEDPEYFKAVSKKRRIKLRYGVLSHYSIEDAPICACCRESEIMFLGIDHINGGGNAHRRTIPHGHYIYQWLKNQGYPSGFQVLCHNCNLAKGFYGQCPHQASSL